MVTHKDLYLVIQSIINAARYPHRQQHPNGSIAMAHRDDEMGDLRLSSPPASPMHRTSTGSGMPNYAEIPTKKISQAVRIPKRP
ncbi:AttH component of AttEFGH ABC transport system [Anopheles sinensis]|uniref:AttH component of AttEFGH ABC transport system n=1 Tax=Anopheles sinensis TaxID=74873 RepID=A0A084W210_ANOSI|nr:AttH component of AttEFGH ABC transport system [Anopheles sinensis]